MAFWIYYAMEIREWKISLGNMLHKMKPMCIIYIMKIVYKVAYDRCEQSAIFHVMDVRG